MINLLNRNGRAIKPAEPKPPAPSDLVTRAECKAIVKAAVEEQTIRICEFYLTQVPEMVVNMVGQIMTAHGMELKPPPKPNDVIAGEPGTVQ